MCHIEYIVYTNMYIIQIHTYRNYISKIFPLKPRYGLITGKNTGEKLKISNPMAFLFLIFTHNVYYHDDVLYYIVFTEMLK